MSLYASLLESGDNSASISRDPVLFNEAKDAAQAKKAAIDPGMFPECPRATIQV